MNDDNNKFEVKLKSEMYNHDNEQIIRRDNKINKNDNNLTLLFIFGFVLFIIILVLIIIFAR